MCFKWIRKKLGLVDTRKMVMIEDLSDCESAQSSSHSGKNAAKKVPRKLSRKEKKVAKLKAEVEERNAKKQQSNVAVAEELEADAPLPENEDQTNALNATERLGTLEAEETAVNSEDVPAIAQHVPEELQVETKPQPQPENVAESSSSESELDEDDDEFSDLEVSNDDTLPSNEAYLETNLDTDPKPSLPEYNILLLGETGSGKSTTINAFANYLKYATFDEAMAQDFVQLIPSKFTLPNPQTGEPFVIQSGSDANEHHGDGNSNTQSPLGYTFKLSDKVLRIIDTPGMGDTRGIDVDRANFDLILSYLNYHQSMHGICVLIKSNETRKTASFRYCISQLLTHLHKSACANIVFCFTFSRNSFYGPGEGFAILRAYLKNELQEVNIELKSGVNCFFIDNEAYRFLVAKKSGYPFPAFQENLYRESWNKSAKQTQAMMDRIFGLEPHNLQQTTSLNYARKIMMELAEPMIQLQRLIHENVNKIKLYSGLVKRAKKTEVEALPNLQFEVDELETRPLAEPMTVCAASKCTDVIDVNGEQQIVYKTQCHIPCHVSGIQTNTIGDTYLKCCIVMNKETQLCKKCSCLWSKHMHQSFEYIRIKRSIIDRNLQETIYRAQASAAESQSVLDVLRKLNREYQTEAKVIQDVAAQFGYLLMLNSNTSFNKFIEPYVDKLITEEEKKLSVVRNYSSDTLKLLETIKERHELAVMQVYQDILSETRTDVGLGDIPQLIKKLFSLKHSGAQFRRMLYETRCSQKQAFKYLEKSGLDLTDQSGPLESMDVD